MTHFSLVLRSLPGLAARSAGLAGALALSACGGASEGAPPARDAPRPIAHAEAAPPPEEDRAQATASPDPLDALIMGLEPPEPASSAASATRAPRTLAEALVGCTANPAEDEYCAMTSVAAFDAATSRWIVLDIDVSEGGPESAWLGVVTPSEEEVVYQGNLTPRRLAAARRALTSQRSSLPLATNLVNERSVVEFSINAYAPLASLSGPLDGWLVQLETVVDLDHPEHVLRLIRRSSREAIELARRAAPRTSCDGDGFYCEAHEDEPCTEDELRAEDRLCVQPFGIDRVWLSSDRATLLVGGTMQVAGHGGYPPFHWVVELPATVRASIAAP